jgi:crossover junction endodeoxyribonuclease RuvC
MIYIGIDPGVTGAVAALDGAGRIISLQDTPTILEKSGKHTHRVYAEPGMASLLEGILRSDSMTCKGCGSVYRTHLANQVFVMIENVHSMPKQGVASSFSFGVGYGVWRGIIAALGLPCMRVEPKVWKKAMGISSAKGKAVSKALKLFPRAELGHAFRGRMIYSDGRAEALLLAQYAFATVIRPAVSRPKADSRPAR